MFVTMNRIFVNPKYAEGFEARFANRAGEVDKRTGFISNQVLRPNTNGDPYVVMTTWASEADFEAWVNSDAFHKGHKRAAGPRPDDMYTAENKLETFTIIQSTEE